jgi:hypothetical protein
MARTGRQISSFFLQLAVGLIKLSLVVPSYAWTAATIVPAFRIPLCRNTANSSEDSLQIIFFTPA